MGQHGEAGRVIERLGSLDPLVARLLGLGATGARVMVGLTGAPGAGKSTLAEHLVAALPPGSGRVVAMDGFHLASETIAGTERARRRGAIDTFDVGGFVQLLERLRRRDEDIVYAPRFAREIEDPIGSAVPIPRDVSYLVVEGNYLLADEPGWTSIRGHLDEIWYIDPDREVRLSRLVARHIEFGKSLDDAVAWSHGSDELNAELIKRGRDTADLVINIDGIPLVTGATDGK